MRILGRLILIAMLLAAAGPLAAQSVQGRVLAQQGREPIEGAAVRVSGLGVQVLTDAEGRFTLVDLPAGRHAIETSHPGYGARVDTVTLDERSDLELEITLAVEAVPLDPINVETRSLTERRRRAQGHSQTMIIDRPEIEGYRDRGARNVADVLELHNPLAVNVRPVMARGELYVGPCVEGSRPSPSAGTGCRHVGLNIDANWIAPVRAVRYLATLRLDEVETIEFLPPAEATFRFGTDYGAGVILVRTRGYAARLATAGSATMPDPTAMPYGDARLSVQLGALFDPYAAGAGVGLLGTVGPEIPLGDRLRLVGEIAFARVAEADRVVAGPGYHVIEHDWWLGLGGLEWTALTRGRLSTTVGLAVGGGMRLRRVTDAVDDPGLLDEPEAGVAGGGIVVPGVSLRYGFSGRAEARLTLRDFIFGLFDGSPLHGPAIGLGVSYR